MRRRFSPPCCPRRWTSRDPAHGLPTFDWNTSNVTEHSDRHVTGTPGLFPSLLPGGRIETSQRPFVSDVFSTLQKSSNMTDWGRH